jgi:hypothetical protein
MPVYTCPDCSTKLKRAEPLPAGKKLRCPECGAVFAPVRAAGSPSAKPAGKSTGKSAAPAKPKPEEKEVFGFAPGETDPDHDNAREDVFAPIKDRFERSARGPALIQVVRPSDWLLRTGSLICIAALLGVLWAIWPLVFKVEVVQPPEKKMGYVGYGDQQRRFKELTDEEFRMRFVYLGIFVGQFLWGAMVCVGASKMHTLESYPLAMIGSIMAAVGPGVPAGILILIDSIKGDDAYMTFIAILLLTIPGLPMALWCLATLRRKDVIAGFQEERPEEYVGDKAIE